MHVRETESPVQSVTSVEIPLAPCAGESSVASVLPSCVSVKLNTNGSFICPNSSSPRQEPVRAEALVAEDKTRVSNRDNSIGYLFIDGVLFVTNANIIILRLIKKQAWNNCVNIIIGKCRMGRQWGHCSVRRE